ncbi:hypothetical protein [Paenibacillus sp. GCM10012303]
MPVQDIWGIGPRLRKHLNRMGDLFARGIDQLPHGSFAKEIWHYG